MKQKTPAVAIATIADSITNRWKRIRYRTAVTQEMPIKLAACKFSSPGLIELDDRTVVVAQQAGTDLLLGVKVGQERVFLPVTPAGQGDAWHIMSVHTKAQDAGEHRRQQSPPFTWRGGGLGRPPGTLMRSPAQGIATQQASVLSPTVAMSHHVLWCLTVAGEGMSKSREPWVTSEEICTYLRISPNTLTRWILARGMPAHRVGRSLRFKVAEVDVWIRSGAAAEDKREDQR